MINTIVNLIKKEISNKRNNIKAREDGFSKYAEQLLNKHGLRKIDLILVNGTILCADNQDREVMFSIMDGKLIMTTPLPCAAETISFANSKDAEQLLNKYVEMKRLNDSDKTEINLAYEVCESQGISLSDDSTADGQEDDNCNGMFNVIMALI